VHDEEPAKLSPDLVRQAIPILQKYRKPGRHFPKVSAGPHYRAELTEEAEALYMRYRFVTSRLRETGSEPQSVAQILYWLQGLKSLSYAPAAWRIWKDALEEARRNDSLVAKQISTLVLVATAKWLFLLVENTPAPAAIAEVRWIADQPLFDAELFVFSVTGSQRSGCNIGIFRSERSDRWDYRFLEGSHHQT
jgi:hypothetical protein